MPSFNPKFSFGRRTSRDHSAVSTKNSREREPLLHHDDQVERRPSTQVDYSFMRRPSVQADIDYTFTRRPSTQADYSFLDLDSQTRLPIYATIHRIRLEIIANIDDPYTYEQLRGPRLNKQVVRPLIDRLYNPRDISIIFCLLVNRVQFAKEETTARHQSISHTRGTLCELLAIRILRRFSEEYQGPQGLLVLSNILVSGFDTFQNAPMDIAEEHSRAYHWLKQGKIESERKLTALEISIISESKNLLCTRPCQRVIKAIYQGRVVYTPTSFVDILPDHYKHKEIHLHNPRASPILDQYRLVVPRTRYYLEIWHFVLLLFLYVAQMEYRDPEYFSWLETLFCVYTFGWILDQCATILEHGWTVYTQNLWTYLDVSFTTSFILYFVLRLIGHGNDKPQLTEVAFDLLAMGAPFLIPRLAFNLLSDNMLFVSLREMMSNFILLTLLAVWSFGGFLMASSWMSRGLHSPLTIGKWMLWLWFGLDSTGIEVSPSFHWLLGPVIMISFAFLGNTLFLTILVSMLSNTFATITANTEAEIQYRRTVVTFEGVKSDAIFNFPPPFNLAALFILLPLKLVLTPRWFHKVIVTSVRTINAPLLLGISFFERRSLWGENVPLSWKRLLQTVQWDMSSLAVHGDLHTVFEVDAPASIFHTPEEEAEDARSDRTHLTVPKPHNHHLAHVSEGGRKDSLGLFFSGPRKESVGPFSEVTEQLHELLQEHGGGGKETQKRFEALESSMSRLEEQLGKLCETLQASGNAEDDQIADDDGERCPKEP